MFWCPRILSLEQKNYRGSCLVNRRGNRACQSRDRIDLGLGESARHDRQRDPQIAAELAGESRNQRAWAFTAGRAAQHQDRYRTVLAQKLDEFVATLAFADMNGRRLAGQRHDDRAQTVKRPFVVRPTGKLGAESDLADGQRPRYCRDDLALAQEIGSDLVNAFRQARRKWQLDPEQPPGLDGDLADSGRI